MAGLLDPSEIAELWGLIDEGYATAQAFNRTPVVVTFVRIDEATSQPVVMDTVELIMLRFGLREGQTVNPFGGLTQTTADGDMRLWADGFIPDVGDLFTWQGFPCKVTKVYPPEQGVVQAEVSLQQVTP